MKISKNTKRRNYFLLNKVKLNKKIFKVIKYNY